MMHLRRAVAILVGALTGLGFLAAGWGVPSVGAHEGAGSGPEVVVGFEPADTVLPCVEPVPAAVATGAATHHLPPAASRDLPLSVLVVADGVDAEEAARLVDLARLAYGPLGVELELAEVHETEFASDGRREGAGGSDETADAERLLADTKGLFDGVRPAGVDMVYAVTAKDLYVGGSEEEDRNYGVAGLADCIGGIRFDDRAFAVGELLGPGIPFVPGVATLFWEAGAKVLAHELGHLVGGHHHYANCAEGVPVGATHTDVASPCTLMFNAVDLSSLGFSTVNGAVARGHADRRVTERPGS